MFGAGGGTSSYEEAENTDLIILWGSNAREAHPIYFHHLLAGIRKGAAMYTIDPRRTASAAFADEWLGLRVGSDIALANAIGREIIAEGLHDTQFIDSSTIGFAEYRTAVQEYTLERAEEITGVPASQIRKLAHAYGKAASAQLCWTLGITEHHNATDNVFALINLALLTGHVGRYGSGLVPIRGQNNVQGSGDMGALPNKLPGFQDVNDPALRAKFSDSWEAEVPPDPGLHISLMLEAMEEGRLRSLYVIGENPVRSEADTTRAKRLFEGLDTLIVQDLFLTATAQLADVVLPAAGWAESEGTVTNSERRVQRTRKALEPPGQARDDGEILSLLAEQMGKGWGRPSSEDAWDELRSLSPMHGGMSYERLEAEGGLQWPCLDLDDPGSKFLHGRLWDDPPGGPPAPFMPTAWQPPVEALDADYPIRLTTGRRLDSFNTGEQTGRYESPNRFGEALCLSPTDAGALGITEGDMVKVSSRRGAVEAPVRIDSGLVTGLAFMSIHFPEQVATNTLTQDVWDPQSGTAEFKATAIRVERIER